MILLKKNFWKYFVIKNMENFIREAKTQLLEEKMWQEWTMNKVPTFVSKCPECDTFNIWSTTGILLDRKCQNCGELFFPNIMKG